MGACNSTVNKKKKKSAANTIEHRDSTFLTQNKPEKRFNPHSVITEAINQVIIKQINDINGDAIKIDKCRESTIIIMDISAQVIISDCKNCNIFIAPCKGSISLRKSEDINLISASQQFRCSDITNCKASLFVISQPAMERAKNFHLGCFIFTYTELLDLFHKSCLSVWDNCWSDYYDYTPTQGNISYFNPKIDIDFVNKFANAFKDQDIRIDEYFPVPFTFGLSLELAKEHNHLLFVFNETYVDQKKLYELLNEETIKSFGTSLVKTAMRDKEDECIKFIKSSLLKNNKKEKADYFNNKLNLEQPNNKLFSPQNKLHVKHSHSLPNLNKFVILWLVNDEDNFQQFLQIAINEFENCLFIKEEDVNCMNDLTKEIFNKFTS